MQQAGTRFGKRIRAARYARAAACGGAKPTVREALMMWLFLDCEWADLAASELVSLALVPEDPARPEFYAERATLPADPTPFVKSVVYPLLNRGRAAMDDLAIATALRRYLASFNAG